MRTSAAHAAPSPQSGLPQTSALAGTSETWRLRPHTGKLRPRKEKVLYRRPHTAAAWSVAVVITPPRGLRLPNSRTSSETTALTGTQAGLKERASVASASR